MKRNSRVGLLCFCAALLLYGCAPAASSAQAGRAIASAGGPTAQAPAVPVLAQVRPTVTAATSSTSPADETAAPAQPEGTTISTAQATETQPEPAAADSGSSTPDATRKPPKYWSEWPLIPESVSPRVREIFLRGLQLGNDPHSFTTIGDCQSQPNIFMGVYDTDNYTLDPGEASLQETIQQFKGSFARDSVTVKDGESVASVFSPAWADPKQCQAKESPLDCEFRLHKPVIVFINLGTNWHGGDDVKHEQYMRKIVDYVIAKGAVPIISSKGDNLEGGHRINISNARVAYDYQLPFWNFWLSIRDLPGKGIDGTRPGGYLIPDAWPRRSHTGLQALDAVWRELKPLMK